MYGGEESTFDHQSAHFLLSHSGSAVATAGVQIYLLKTQQRIGMPQAHQRTLPARINR